MYIEPDTVGFRGCIQIDQYYNTQHFAVPALTAEQDIYWKIFRELLCIQLYS